MGGLSTVNMNKKKERNHHISYCDYYIRLYIVARKLCVAFLDSWAQLGKDIEVIHLIGVVSNKQRLGSG